MAETKQLLERAKRAFDPPSDVMDALERLALRRDRKHRNQRIRAGVLGVAIAVAVGLLGINAIRSTSHVPADDRSEELGIFAPVAGRIVYGDRLGIWGVDPAAPADPATRVQLTTEAGTPLGWSSDGTRLLIMQTIRDERVVAGGRGHLRLSILNADGSQTQVAESPHWIPGATISPDGSRVVFATYKALYSVDVGGGPVEVLLERGGDAVYAPTFSPDGAKIAYIVGSGDHSHRVWVMNADGSDRHKILANKTTMGGGHVLGLAWSPAGDRIALGNDVATYTFATDGSGFTQVIANGTRPYWSPDGSHIAYLVPESILSRGGLSIADADGSNVRSFGFGDSGPWNPARRSE